MEKFGKRSRWRERAVVWGIIICGLTAGVVAEDLFVQLGQVQVKSGRGQLFPSVDTVKRNDKLQVLERAADGWIRVRTPSGKEGYVFQKTVGANPTAGQTSVGVSDTEAQNLAAPAASKGLEPESKQYASTKNYNPAALNRVTALNEPSDEKANRWTAFCNDGKVGPARGQP